MGCNKFDVSEADIKSLPFSQYFKFKSLLAESRTLKKCFKVELNVMVYEFTQT